MFTAADLSGQPAPGATVAEADCAVDVSLNKFCYQLHDRVDGDSASAKLAGQQAIYIFPLWFCSFFFCSRRFTKVVDCPSQSF